MRAIDRVAEFTRLRDLPIVVQSANAMRFRSKSIKSIRELDAAQVAWLRPSPRSGPHGITARA